MKHKSCHWNPQQKKIIIDGRKYRPHHQDTSADKVISAHLEGDNTVVVTVKLFASSTAASHKVVFKNVGLNSAMTGGTKIKL